MVETQSRTITMLSIEPGAIVAGRYEICAKVGTGGMGVVFRVIDRHLNDEVVALKLLHPHLAEDEEVFGRFRNEVLVARALSHPNIVRLHDIGKAEQGFYYISMEFVDGYCLKDRIPGTVTSEDLPPLTFNDAVVVLYQLCSAVAYAHGKGIIHRDLKPANVMMTKQHEVKLSDFGTARIVGISKNFTQTGQVIGTPDYMSPEQIQGHSLDAKCDIYSLGMIAFELATGRKPFAAESSVALAFKHMTEPVPRFATSENGIPKWYEELVLVASEKDKEKRFSSVVEMARILSECSPGVTGTGALFLAEGTRRFSIGSGVSATGRIDSSGFELGKPAATGGGDDWSFGPTNGAGSLPTEPAKAQSVTQPQRSSSWVTSLILVLLLVVVAGLVVVRFVPPVNLLVQGAIFPQGSVEKKEHLWLATVLGVEPPLPAIVEPEPEMALATDAPVVSSVESSGHTEKLRQELDDELLAGIGTGVTESVPPVSPPEATVAPTEAPTAEVPQTEIPPPAVEVSPPAVEPPVEIVPEKAPLESPEVLILEGKLILRDAEREVSAGSLAIDRLANLEWRARISGFRETKAEKVKDRVTDSFAVALYDVSRGKEIGQVQAISTRAVPGSGEKGVFDIGGRLKGIGRPSPGEFELQLKQDDRVLTAIRMNLYRAEIATSTPPDKSISTGGSVLPMPPPPVAQTPPPENTLPPAQGGRGVVGGTVPVITEVAPEQIVPVPAAERYQGSVTLADGTNLTLELNLTFSGEDITGSGSVGDLGRFTAQGKVFPRGLEITLTNESVGIRLSGARSGNSLRGRYSLPARQEKGTWEATIR